MMPKNQVGGVTEQLAQTYTHACTALAKNVRTHVSDGFHGNCFTTLHKLCLKYHSKCENLPKTL
jgi:hypothetical protein